MADTNLNTRLENLMNVFGQNAQENQDDVTEKSKEDILNKFKSFVDGQNKKLESQKLEVLAKIYILSRHAETSIEDEDERNEYINQLKDANMYLDFQNERNVREFLTNEDTWKKDEYLKKLNKQYIQFKNQRDNADFLKQIRYNIQKRLNLAKARNMKSHDMIGSVSDSILGDIMPNIEQQVGHLGYQGMEGMLAVIGYQACTKLFKAIVATSTGNLEEFKLELIEGAGKRGGKMSDEEKRQQEIQGALSSAAGSAAGGRPNPTGRGGSH